VFEIKLFNVISAAATGTNAILSNPSLVGKAFSSIYTHSKIVASSHPLLGKFISIS
jgi:hypothetical protein